MLPVQDLPRSADHAANRTIFTWHIDMVAVRRRVASELVHSIGNLRSRMEHEVSRRAEVSCALRLLLIWLSVLFQVLQMGSARRSALTHLKISVGRAASGACFGVCVQQRLL